MVHEMDYGEVERRPVRKVTTSEEWNRDQQGTQAAHLQL